MQNGSMENTITSSLLHDAEPGLTGLIKIAFLQKQQILLT